MTKTFQKNKPSKQNYWKEIYSSALLKKNELHTVPLIIYKYIKKKANEKYIELM
jgi:hypothetical protein